MRHFSTGLPARASTRAGVSPLRRAAHRALFGLGLSSLALAARAQDLPTVDKLRQPVLFNLKSGFNLSTYTGGGYIGWQTGLKGGFTGGLSATRRLAARSA